MSTPMSPAAWALHKFKKWEQPRGRAWTVSDEPCRLEAFLAPLNISAFTMPPASDDSRRDSLLSSAALFLFGETRHDPDPIEAKPDQVVVPDTSNTSASDLTVLRVALPGHGSHRTAHQEQLLATLQKARHPLSWEFLGTHDGVHHQIVARREDAAICRQMLTAYTDVVIEEIADPLASSWASNLSAATVDFGLARACIYPLATDGNDPLPGVVGALESLRYGELATLQILFQPVSSPDWAKVLVRAVSIDDQSIASDVDYRRLAQAKVSKPLYAVIVRAAAVAQTEERAFEIVRAIGAALSVLNDAGGNALRPMKNAGYLPRWHRHAFLTRTTFRTGALINARELSCLVALPVGVRSEKLYRTGRKTKAAPADTRHHDFIIGDNFHAGQTVEVSLSQEQKSRHAWVIGASGSGKSSLLAHWAVTEARLGGGFCVVDPHGSTIDRIISHIPPSRMQDVILFDPSAEQPIGINLLAAHPSERQALADDLAAIFQRLSTSAWSDQVSMCLHMALWALWDSGEEHTLVSLQMFLADPSYRRHVLSTVTDEDALFFWHTQFALMRSAPHASLLTRLHALLRPSVKAIVGRPGGLDLEEVVNGGRILLVRLSTGVGSEAVNTLGSIIIARILGIAMARQAGNGAQHRPFHILLDEAHLYTCPSLAFLLSGARKFGLHATVCHQFVRQIAKFPDVLSALLGNAGNRVFFRLGDEDAAKVGHDFAGFDAHDLASLQTGEAICRVGPKTASFNLTIRQLPSVAPDQAAAKHEAIVRHTRERYGRPPEPAPTLIVPPACEAPTSPPAQLSCVPPAADQVQPNDPTNKPLRDIEAKTDRAPEAPEVEVLPQPAIKTSKPRPAGPSAKHREIQWVIKQAGEDAGFLVTLEHPILDGRARIDAVMARGEKRIAVEVCVSSSPKQEVAHFATAIEAGFSMVIAVAADPKVLDKIEKVAMRTLSVADQPKVRYMTPDQVLTFLKTTVQAVEAKTEIIKGWKVSTEYDTSQAGAGGLNKDAMSQIVVQALRRMKDEKS